MDKILTYLLILAITNDERKANMIVDVLYNDKPAPIKSKTVGVKKVAPKVEPVVNDKQKEIMDAIAYLKSKPKKTKEDRDKIQMLEVILKTI